MNTQAIAPVVMQNLVAVVESGALMTTSIKVAEAFGKRHDNVLAKLKTLQCSSDFRLLNFKEASQTVQQPNGGTAEYKIWSMTKDGFMFLVMGFTGTKAATIKEAYIAEFNRMADEIHRRELATLVDDIPFHRLPANCTSATPSNWLRPSATRLAPPVTCSILTQAAAAWAAIAVVIALPFIR